MVQPTITASPGCCLESRLQGREGRCPQKEAAAIVWVKDLDGWTRVVAMMVVRGIVPVTNVLPKTQCSAGRIC